MTGFVDVLRFVNLFAAAILTGSLAFEFVVVVPSLKRFDPETGARVHKVMLGFLPDLLLPPAGGIASVSVLLLLVLHSHLTSTQTLLYAIGAVFWIALGYSTFVISRPVNKRIGAWDLDAETHAEYPEVLSGFQRIHAFRTAVGILGMTFFILANVAG